MSDKRTCKVCNQEKVAVYSHMGKNGGKVYKDEKGRLWKSYTCCDCQAEIRRKARAFIKSQENNEGGSSEGNPGV